MAINIRQEEDYKDVKAKDTNIFKEIYINSTKDLERFHPPPVDNPRVEVGPPDQEYLDRIDAQLFTALNVPSDVVRAPNSVYTGRTKQQQLESQILPLPGVVPPPDVPGVPNAY